MGSFTYGTVLQINVDDNTLYTLQKAYELTVGKGSSLGLVSVCRRLDGSAHNVNAMLFAGVPACFSYDSLLDDLDDLDSTVVDAAVDDKVFVIWDASLT